MKKGRFCNPREKEVKIGRWAVRLIEDVVSGTAPSAPEWVFSGRVSVSAVHNIARQFDYDNSRLMLVPDLSSKQNEVRHYFMYLSVKPLEDLLKEQGKNPYLLMQKP